MIIRPEESIFRADSIYIKFELLPGRIHCRDVLKPGIFIAESSCIDCPHCSRIDIDKKDIVCSCIIFDKLIIDCARIIDPIFRNIIPEDIPPDRLTLVICYQ